MAGIRIHREPMRIGKEDAASWMPCAACGKLTKWRVAGPFHPAKKPTSMLCFRCSTETR